MVKVIRNDYGPDDPIFSQGPQFFVPVSRPDIPVPEADRAEVEEKEHEPGEEQE